MKVVYTKKKTPRKNTLGILIFHPYPSRIMYCKCGTAIPKKRIELGLRRQKQILKAGRDYLRRTEKIELEMLFLGKIFLKRKEQRETKKDGKQEGKIRINDLY